MKRVAGIGFEPMTGAYETPEITISLTRKIFLRQDDVLDHLCFAMRYHRSASLAAKRSHFSQVHTDLSYYLSKEHQVGIEPTSAEWKSAILAIGPLMLVGTCCSKFLCEIFAMNFSLIQEINSLTKFFFVHDHLVPVWQTDGLMIQMLDGSTRIDLRIATHHLPGVMLSLGVALK